MNKLAIAALLGSVTLAGCSSMPLSDKQDLIIDGQQQTVKVVNIPSFEVEVAPNQAVCTIMDANGNPVQSKCLQYRQTFQKNFNTLSGNIQGFTFEPGYRYVLDLKQQAVEDQASGQVKPVWILNDIVSKKSEQIQ